MDDNATIGIEGSGSSSGALRRALSVNEARALLKLGGPIVFTQIAQMAIGTTDVLMVGALGKEPLAAAALGLTVYYGVWLLGMGPAIAVGPMIAHIIGAQPNDKAGVRACVRMGLWVAFVAALPLAAVLAACAPILHLIGEPADLADATGPFALALAAGLPFSLGFIVLRNFATTLNRPNGALVVVVLTVLFNALADYALIFGHFGLPRLGLLGSGIASASSFLFQFVAMLAVVEGTPDLKAYRIFRRFFHPVWAKVSELFRLGTPIGLSAMFEMMFFNAGTLIIGYFGADALAAHQIALNVASLAFMVPLGLGQAGAVRVGLAAGAQNAAGVRQAGVTMFAVASGFMLFCAALFVLFPRSIVGLYIAAEAPENAAVVANAVLYLWTAAAFELFDGLQAVAIHALRGLKDAKVPMILTGIAYWLVGFPAALLLAFPVGLAGWGVWIAFVLSLIVAAATLILRFAYKSGLITEPLFARD